jgi:hypothetical protein
MTTQTVILFVVIPLIIWIALRIQAYTEKDNDCS